jgi:TPR repeat protein
VAKSGPDFQKAVYWYKKAADLNNAKAETNLGLLYESDALGKSDYLTAYVWLRLAAAAGEPAGMHSCSDLLAANRLSDVEIAEGDKQVIAFRAAHHIDGPLPPPPHLMTPDSMMIEKALEKKLQQEKGAATNAAPAPVGTGTK